MLYHMPSTLYKCTATEPHWHAACIPVKIQENVTEKPEALTVTDGWLSEGIAIGLAFHSQGSCPILSPDFDIPLSF